jgi:hypothetical protein
LPEFSGEEAGEAVVLGEAGEVDLVESGGVVREVGDAEIGEDTKDEVEAAYVGAGDGAHGAGGWDAEVGDEPEGLGGEVRSDLGDEDFELGLGEAVEEEVGDDQVVFFRGRGAEGEGVGFVGLEAIGERGATLAKEMEHGGAGVDSFGLEVGVLSEELGEEAAVAVAQDEGGFLLGQTWEVVEARLVEDWAEG